MAIFSWSEAKLLDTSLISLDGYFSQPPVKAQTLTGGLTNRCWKLVSADGAEYVWRPITPITNAFFISRHEEYQVLSAIERLGIGPSPIVVNEQGLLVEWVAGDTLYEGLDIDDLLKTLISVHLVNTARLPLKPFSFTARVDHYWLQLDAVHQTEAYSSIYKEWRTTPSIPSVELSLCHFDLGGYNLVKNSGGIKIIDWEYAAIADPRLDLTLTISVADAPVQETVEKYCQLRCIHDVQPWLDGVEAWLPRSRMMAMLWYLLAHQLWGDESYLREAEALSHTFCS
ncbi:Thiamine kinase [Vibrio chagasii]|nr:Thiamine kinase [Vibrio chagasii]CAH6912833.1 Thiamine kinase [Vibrio chagasii]CAH7002653.1 Thiamine kinase [Vibrio chagasii]CAH7058955.1 Thiamine kinase [Vibrio chagasii]CAH7125159.1 Thiamine kinase [Vibrio chagasii]